MRGLITCFAVVCLSLASGAPAEGEHKDYVKSFSFDNGEVINSLYPFWNDEITYAVCDGSGADKKCKVYVESTSQENNSTRSCDLSLKYTGRFDYNVFLTHAGNSKVVLAVRGDESKIKLISVEMKSCRHHEASISVSKESMKNDNFVFSSYVTPHEDNYDIFFRNWELCQDFFCKATFDYEGKVVKEASIVPVSNLGLGLFRIESTDNGYLAYQSTLNEVIVHFIKNADKQNVTLFTGRMGGYFLSLSTKENKLAFCTLMSLSKVVCKQYDAEGKTKNIDTEIHIADQKSHVLGTLDVLNLEKGFLALVNGVQSVRGETFVAVAHVDEQGKQGKTIIVDLECPDRLLLGKLYRNGGDQFCLNAICMTTFDNSNRSKFSTASRCFLEKELF